MRLVVMKRSALSLSLLAVLLLAGSLSSAAEPQSIASWKSFRNGNDLRGVAGEALPEKLISKWTVKTKQGIPGSPTIDQGFVFCGTLDGELLCIDAQTGEVAWKYSTAEDAAPNSFAPGFKSAPLVNDTSVMLGDEDGIFHCVDRKTGQLQWKFETFGEIVSSASQIDDRIVFGSYDNCLYCLNAKTGEQFWKYETEGYVNCTPAIINGFTFVTGCDEQLRIIDIQNGEQVKQMPLNTYLIASPAIWENELYVGTYASEVICVNWKDLTLQWTYRSSVGEFPYHSSAAVTSEMVVVGGRDKQLHAINRQDGKEIWTYPTRGKIDSSPVIAGEDVFFGCDDGRVYRLNLKTGKELWSERIGRKVPGSPAVGNGLLVIGAAESNGELHAFGPASQ
ncbi:MAG: PQQ-binding-like beta-propeller repeat protein [Planctomycetaceae bacterium]|nr:PQQ-binding-like beta-propeller repeat protein [Planctomycetaceae bacterium]